MNPEPMSNEARARTGGQATARKGADHMAAVGRRGRSALDLRIAAEAGIPAGLPTAQFKARLQEARAAYFARLAERRWGPR